MDATRGLVCTAQCKPDVIETINDLATACSITHFVESVKILRSPHAGEPKLGLNAKSFLGPMVVLYACLKGHYRVWMLEDGVALKPTNTYASSDTKFVGLAMCDQA